MNLTDVDTTQFQTAQQSLVEILSGYDSQMNTKKASAIRELVIRPFAYLHAKVQNMIDQWLEQTSIKRLSQSPLTQNQIADIVASNYFVQRNSGRFARGVVTLTCNAQSARIPYNSQFSIDNQNFYTQTSILATTTPGQDTTYVSYVKMLEVDGRYIVNVPVVSAVSGQVQIPVGAQVQILSNLANVIDAQLTSPITGGASIQTDAQMMQRCKARCGAAIGTLGAYKVKLQGAPVSVISCNALGGSQPGCFRARYNNLGIPYGGIVDLYVKTANQASIASFVCTPIKNEDGTSTVILTGNQYLSVSGLLRVTSLSVASGQVPQYTVSYKSADTNVQDEGARLSVTQQVRIDIQDKLEQVTVTVQYLPGIKDIQDYLDSYHYAYLGQDCLVKSAVPVTTSIQGNIYSASQVTQQDLQNIKTFIATQVNSIPVGDYVLNMSNIAQAVQSNFPGIRMRLPYTIQAQMPMTNGGTYTFHSTNGTLDLSFRQGMYMWDKYACFFSTTPSQITLEVAFR